MAATPEVALRKRQQIAKANRMMFVWIAAASVVVGFALVGGKFLVDMGLYNNDVLAEKSKTAKTLRGNEAAALELIKQVQVRNTSEALRSVMAPGETEPIRVVLDALPARGNSSAFGSSLQNRFLDKPGIEIESLVVDPIAEEMAADETGVEDASAPVADGGAAQYTVGFSFSVNVPADQIVKLQELLQELERSIRTVHMQTVKLERQGDKFLLSVTGYAYYQPAKSAELTEKTVPLRGGNKAKTPAKQEVKK